jgi:hypothetical protein
MNASSAQAVWYRWRCGGCGLCTIPFAFRHHMHALQHRIDFRFSL